MHHRLETATDARTGTTSYSYFADDQVHLSFSATNAPGSKGCLRLTEHPSAFIFRQGFGRHVPATAFARSSGVTSRATFVSRHSPGDGGSSVNRRETHGRFNPW